MEKKKYNLTIGVVLGAVLGLVVGLILKENQITWLSSETSLCA